MAKIGFRNIPLAGGVRSTTPVHKIVMGGKQTGGGSLTQGGSAPTGLAPDQYQSLQMIGQTLGQNFDAARAANEARYQKLLELADQFGATQQRQTNELYDQRQAQNLQNLIGAGLGNSTVLSSNAIGIDNARANALADINQQVAQQKAGIIERRTDEYPNLSMFASLLQNPGALQNGTLDLLKSFLGL